MAWICTSLQLFCFCRAYNFEWNIKWNEFFFNGAKFWHNRLYSIRCLQTVLCTAAHHQKNISNRRFADSSFFFLCFFWSFLENSIARTAFALGFSLFLHFLIFTANNRQFHFLGGNRAIDVTFDRDKQNVWQKFPFCLIIIRIDNRINLKFYLNRNCFIQFNLWKIIFIWIVCDFNADKTTVAAVTD